MGKLTATGVKQAKPKDKAYKMPDGGGMYLLVNKTGGKYWRYDYRFAGKRKTLALGTYPEISLLEARELHMSARKELADNIDPAEAKKVAKLTRHIAANNSFEAIGREWFEQKIVGKSKSYHDRTLRILEKDLYPYIGSRPINEISVPELLSALRRIEDRGANDIAHRAKQTSGQVFRYAMLTARADRDPSQVLTEALRPRYKKHHAAITDPKDVGPLLRAIDAYQGSFIVKTALQLSPLLFQRPGEIRQMEWAEINWELKRWEIPAEKMKMRHEHIVPLASQSIDLLKALYGLTGRGRYVFPSARGGHRPLSDNGVRTALRALGYTNEQMSPHGFRAMARTILDEVLEYRVDWIEHQLAHAVKDATGRAYNRTTHIDGRTDMMQGWADYLDGLKNDIG
jgi:integrase